MKKKNIIMVTAVLLIGAAGLFAALPEGMAIDLSLGAGANQLTVDGTDFMLSLEPEATIYFDMRNGIDTRLGFYTGRGNNSLNVGVGYAFRYRLNSNLDYSIKAGFDYSAYFADKSSLHTYGMYLGADLYLDVYDNLFVSVGIRDTIQFGKTFKSGDISTTEGDLDNLLILPRVAIGYTF